MELSLLLADAVLQRRHLVADGHCARAGGAVQRSVTAASGEGEREREEGEPWREHAPVSSPRDLEGLWDLYDPLEDGRERGRGGESGEARWPPFDICVLERSGEETDGNRRRGSR